MNRRALRLAADEPDQVPRRRLPRRDPGVIIGAGEFGTWQALIPEAEGETVVSRHRLCELLDRLDALTAQHPDRPDGSTG